jgi:hypothetical protein
VEIRVGVLRKLLVPVVMPDPFHGKRQAIFVAALGHQVEDRIISDQRLAAALVTRVSVKDIAAGVL